MEGTKRPVAAGSRPWMWWWCCWLRRCWERFSARGAEHGRAGGPSAYRAVMQPLPLVAPPRQRLGDGSRS